MERWATHERTEPMEFERLEGRLMLDGASTGAENVCESVGGPLAGPEVHDPAPDDSPAPQTPVAPANVTRDWEPVCGVDGSTYGAASAPEPTSLTFNGRGIDLNEDAKVDALASIDLDGVVTRLLSVHTATSSTDTDGFVQVPFVQDPQEKCEPADWPIVIDILGSTKDFEMAGADGIVFRMGGVHNDLDAAEADALAGAGAESHLDVGYEDGKLKLGFSAEGDDIVFLVPEFNPYEQAAGAAGHCKIMAIRVANPEQASAGGPLGAVMGGVGSILCGGKGGGIGGILGGRL